MDLEQLLREGIKPEALLTLAGLIPWTILGVSLAKFFIRGDDGISFSGRATLLVAFIWALIWALVATFYVGDGVTWRSITDAALLAIIAAAGAVGIKSTAAVLKGKTVA